MHELFRPYVDNRDAILRTVVKKLVDLPILNWLLNLATEIGNCEFIINEAG